MMHTNREQANTMDQPSEDDMTEGDLGNGTRSVGGSHRSRIRSKGELVDLPPYFKPSKRHSEESGGSFSWTSCSAMYTAFRKELEEERIAQWRIRDSEISDGDSSEKLQRRLQEVTEEVELLRTELEVTHRHLEGKHEALRILQGQAILDKATSHTKILLQKSEERTKALEKEVNALQWEITFNQVQFKNLEQTWELKYNRVCAENQVLRKTLDERLEQFQELHRENTALSQQCLELLGLLNAQERGDFEKTQPPCSQSREGTSLELAVYGACKCSFRDGQPCSCAKSAAASRKQVLQLKQELELQKGRKDEAYVMVDAFRIAFEQQLKRGSEKVLQLAKSNKEKSERGKQGSAGMTRALKRFLPSLSEGKVLSHPKETLQLLLDLLSDKEEALAHQRKVSYMLAQSYQELEKRLQAQLKPLDTSYRETKLKPDSNGSERTTDSTADHPLCLCDNIPAIMDEDQEKTRREDLQK